MNDHKREYQSARLLLAGVVLVLSVAMVGCGIDDTQDDWRKDMDIPIYGSNGVRDDAVENYLGTYAGRWIADGETMGATSMAVKANLVFAEMPHAFLLKSILPAEMVEQAAQTVATSPYKVPFTQTAYSATALYFSIPKVDYTFTYTLNGLQHTVTADMAGSGSVAVFDKQSNMFTVLLKMVGVTIDGARTADYGKERTLKFNSTARTNGK